ncbi:30S ribosomal protein THX [Spirochaeta thermophila]|uniref:30S ribosomal protein THX n=1 Tax=Winmispira thermophila (strain ATCC 700085 / DSM 6578 / Z-1203) TaxID=869211 RepID=G0G9V2_WINT7|nr:30S ribosomal protein THX [Spirochaeta thermophila]AEJ60852.1 hypothetical protein Spith_0572 [Spirochaeta thermophila DSM 6578]
MGKGDKKSRKGKIWRGTYGNTRPKPKNLRRRKRQQGSSS